MYNLAARLCINIMQQNKIFFEKKKIEQAILRLIPIKFVTNWTKGTHL